MLTSNVLIDKDIQTLQSDFYFGDYKHRCKKFRFFSYEEGDRYISIFNKFRDSLGLETSRVIRRLMFCRIFS